MLLLVYLHQQTNSNTKHHENFNLQKPKGGNSFDRR